MGGLSFFLDDEKKNFLKKKLGKKKQSIQKNGGWTCRGMRMVFVAVRLFFLIYLKPSDESKSEFAGTNK